LEKNVQQCSALAGGSHPEQMFGINNCIEMHGNKERGRMGRNIHGERNINLG